MIQAIGLLLAVYFIYKISGKHQFKKRRNEGAFRFEGANYQRQLDLVREASFSSQPLHNIGERRAYWAMIQIIRQQLDNRYQVHAQVNLGEFLRSDGSKDAFSAINSKRVDFCITKKKDHQPVMVVEIHGKGHYNETAFLRDEVKRIACEKAGIHYEAVVTKELWSQQDFTQHLEPILTRRLSPTR